MFYSTGRPLDNRSYLLPLRTQRQVVGGNMITVYADLCSNHKGNKEVFSELLADVIDAGAVPKVQLFSPKTFNREWLSMPNPFVASVFKFEDIDFIMPYNPQALKVASVESTHFDLIKLCMATALPLIISTGGMDESELMQLIDVLGDYDSQVCLMHCVALYPTPPDQVNLYRLKTLADVVDGIGLDWDLGWSCHVDPRPNLANLMSMAAMAYVFGAEHFEVHVRPAKGTARTPDEIVAMTPHMLKMFVEHLDQLEIWEGSEDLVGPDRESVVEWRKRWQPA